MPRIFKDPLQAKLRRMEKINKSTTPTGTIFDSLKIRRPFENVKRVNSSKSKKELKSSEELKIDKLTEAQKENLARIKYYELVYFELNLKNLKNLALWGHKDYLVLRKEIEKILIYRFGKTLKEFPENSKIRLFIEKADRTYFDKIKR